MADYWEDREPVAWNNERSPRRAVSGGVGPEREARLAEIRLAITTERADDVLRPIRYKVYRDESYEASNPEVRVLFERIKERENQARVLLAELEAAKSDISWRDRLEKVIAQVEEVSHNLSTPEDGVKVRLALAVFENKTSPPNSTCELHD